MHRSDVSVRSKFAPSTPPIQRLRVPNVPNMLQPYIEQGIVLTPKVAPLVDDIMCKSQAKSPPQDQVGGLFSLLLYEIVNAYGPGWVIMTY